MTDETIFATALEKADPAERADYLETVGKEDPAQRKRIEVLLAAHEKAVGFLERPPVAPAEPEHAPTRAFRGRNGEAGDGPTRAEGENPDEDIEDALSFLEPPGRPDSLGRLGHYEVLEVLGRGGFGIVYRAFDEVLQRVVAVKVLSPTMAATSPARKRFIREAQSAAPIQHENVVRVHAVGETPLPYLVMEFISGETLQQRLDRTGPLEATEVVRIGRQVAEGLAAAHERGLIHRDIKPSNILIENATFKARITDFGLARAADDASLTRSGVVAGTPMYMAPEQARGETLDHCADLFSLGSVMYALLTGHPPFRAETTLAVLKRVAEEDPRPIREVIPEVPEWLCRIVDKLHAKNPADRYQSAKEVAEVLADCEKQLQTHRELKDFARIPAVKPEPAAARRRGRLKWAALAALIILTFGGVLFGRAALLYASNRGELELQPQEGLVSIIVLQNDDGVFDENRLDPAVTDWLSMKKPQKLKLPPGKYQLNASLWPAGSEVSLWEVTTSDLFGRSKLLMPNRPGHDSVIVSVERGKRVTVRPVIRSLSEIEKRNRDAIDGNRLKDIAKAVHDVGNDGFVSLFNGKDLTGWKAFPEDHGGSWKVENGILVGSGKPSHLFTQRGDFGNFHLRMETRVRKSGAKAGALGVFARVPLQDPGMIISPHGESGTYRIGVPKLYDPKVAPPDPAPPSYREKPLVVWGVDLQGDKTNIKQFSADEWFTHELIVDGKNVSIQTKQGNQSSHSFIFAGAQGPPTGHIALQLFDDWSAVEFRKIEIKELPPTQQSRGVLMVLRARGNSAVYDFPGELTTESPQELTSHLLARVGKNPGLVVMLDTGEGFDLKSNLHANMLARAQALITATGARAQLSTRLVAELSRPAVIAQKRSERSELLRQIGIATHGYSDTHGSLPPAKLRDHPEYFDAEGRPHLSWRVHILPFLDQEPLYKKFHLNEPWDSEHNKILLAEMPAVFKTTLDPTKTTILSVVGKGTAYEGKNGLKMADIAAGDGTSSTAYVVDVGADKAVPWTKPQDMQFDAEDPIRAVGSTDLGSVFLALMGDGSVQSVPRDVAPESLKALFTRAAGDTYDSLPQRFVPLFNGKNLNGWKSNADKFFVTKDGSILANPIENEYGMLRTVKEYENYELRMFCKPTGQFQADSKAVGWVGLRATDGLTPAQPKPGITVHMTSGRAPDVHISSVGELAKGLKFEKTRGATEGWNELRVVRAGATLTVSYNGERRWMYDTCPVGRGSIALWAEGGDVYFRDIQIRELPSSAAAKVGNDAVKSKVGTTSGGTSPLEGRWSFAFAEFEEKPVSAKEAKETLPSALLFKGSRYGFTWPGRKDEGGFRIDPAKTPAEIDFTGSIFEGLEPRKAIYKLDGDRLTICLGFVGPKENPERPTEFKSDPKGKNILLVYRRDKQQPPSQDAPGDAKQPLPRPKAPPPEAVLQPLRDAIAAKARIRDTTKHRVDAGFVGKIELLKADMDLLEARIELAEAEGDAKAVADGLEELVKACEAEREIVAAQVDVGVEPRVALDRVDVRIAAAKLRLAKARGAAAPVAPPPRLKY